MTFHKWLDDGPIRSDIMKNTGNQNVENLHYESRQLVSAKGTDVVCHLDFTLPVYTTKPHYF